MKKIFIKKKRQKASTVFGVRFLHVSTNKHMVHLKTGRIKNLQ